MGSPLQPDITALLSQAGKGNREALDKLMPLVYEDLRSRAAAQMNREIPGHTLQTTALVHEAFVKLVDQRQVEWQDRAHFLAIAATCIRRILVDHARKRCAEIHGGGKVLMTLHEQDLGGHETPADLLSLHDALNRLAEMDARKAKVIELRYFGGIKNDEIASALEISLGTVERDLRLARAWLKRELQGGMGS
ncbi:MAG: sigma-70 family RNA polymerase sigma factor [Planctomycetes bacterium]|nr:sigma-70 family RNA polymerase sigma factor [Planctomycetota bacterium]